MIHYERHKIQFGKDDTALKIQLQFEEDDTL